jgi:hypothetical protein
MKHIYALAALLATLASPAAHALQIAECVTEDGEAGAYLFTDGADVVLQVATVTTQVDVYRSNAGNVTPVPIDADKLAEDLALGFRRSLVLTKPSSVQSGGIVTEAALVAIQLQPASATFGNTWIARRSQVLALSCAEPGVP